MHIALDQMLSTKHNPNVSLSPSDLYTSIFRNPRKLSLPRLCDFDYWGNIAVGVGIVYIQYVIPAIFRT